jgi:hypothetical protein
MTKSTTGRRWFQFSLGSLFWLTLVAATASYGFREHRERVRLEEILNPVPPNIFTADLDIPYGQDTFTISPAPSQP